MDVERIASCMPGAEIVEVIDDKTYKGRVSVRLGPVALTFGGIAKFEMIDEAGRTARVSARGADPKGRGGADAKVTFSLGPDGDGDGTRVEINTDLQLSGSIAQYGRGAGMISDLATQLVGQFATNLNAQLAAENGDAALASDGPAEAIGTTPEEQPAAAPISGFSLGLRVLWNAVKRLFGRS
jgi:carbon monoxide dehydrogenase subunit G